MSRLASKVPVPFCLGLALALALVLPLAASAQQAQTSFTFVAQWEVPRDKWGEISTFAEKSWRPLLERLTNDGTLTDYGIFETIVHQDGAPTHSIAFSANSFAGIEKARLEALKVPAPPALAAAKHSDLFLSNVLSKRRPASGTGYLRVNSVVVQAGKGAQWREAWEKYNKPTFDELVANGTLSAYAIQTQAVATVDPNTRYVVFIYPSAESVDRVGPAFQAANQKRSPDERTAVTNAFQQVVVAGSNRAFIARAIAYSLK